MREEEGGGGGGAGGRQAVGFCGASGTGIGWAVLLCAGAHGGRVQQETVRCRSCGAMGQVAVSSMWLRRAVMRQRSSNAPGCGHAIGTIDDPFALQARAV